MTFLRLFSRHGKDSLYRHLLRKLLFHALKRLVSVHLMVRSDPHSLLEVVFQFLEAVLAGTPLPQDLLHLALFLTKKRSSTL